MLVLLDTPCEQAAIQYMKEQLDYDMKAVENNAKRISLLAKWLPSVNTSNREKVRLGKKLCKAFGMTEKEYRKTLSVLRDKINIIENYLRRSDYSFAYEKQPGKAMLKYRAAFYRNDEERYQEYLNRVDNHEAVLHTDTLMPYEIVKSFYGYNQWFRPVSDHEAKALDTTWKALPDYTDNNSNALVVVDTSGSMLWSYGNRTVPMTVATSLGLYFAERNKGAFANHFMIFSNKPQLIKIQGETLQEKLEYISTYNEVADTNIQAVFELILNTARKHNIPQDEMPERIFIVSDMEFNCCVSDGEVTNFEYAKELYHKAGYELPKVVFWNVASRVQQLPVTKNEQGVTLVSGCNARLFQQVMTDQMDPYTYMMEIIGSARYEKIVA